MRKTNNIENKTNNFIMLNSSKWNVCIIISIMLKYPPFRSTPFSTRLFVTFGFILCIEIVNTISNFRFFILFFPSFCFFFLLLFVACIFVYFVFVYTIVVIHNKIQNIQLWNFPLNLYYNFFCHLPKQTKWWRTAGINFNLPIDLNKCKWN